MRIIALEREVGSATADDYTSHAEAKARVLHELYQAGVVREMYFRIEREQAVLLLEAADNNDASKSLAQLPFVRHGLIEFELIPLRPYPGFQRLFTGS